MFNHYRLMIVVTQIVKSRFMGLLLIASTFHQKALLLQPELDANWDTETSSSEASSENANSCMLARYSNVYVPLMPYFTPIKY